MASYAQPGAKRQKVRERTDNVDYFQGIEKLEFNSSAPLTETTSYRYYCASERTHSRSMEDWLKLSVSLTDFRTHGPETSKAHARSWDDASNSLDNHKRCLKALFDLMSKIGVKYWTAFDTDLVPWSDSWEEYKTNWEDMMEYVHELGQRSHVKLLWLAPDLHSHARYTAGAFTNPDASSFIQAATQIKKCLEVAQRLNAECFLLWPCRESYHSLFQTDLQREIKLFVKLLKMCAEYKERLNFRCHLLIMPYYTSNTSRCSIWGSTWSPQEDLENRYMWDVTSCLYLLKSYNLDRYYKVCSWPGHHMFMASVYNMLGGVTITNDFYDCDNKKLTMMMKSIVDQGTPLPAGINLKLSSRPDSDLRELVTLYVKHIDRAARALRTASSMAAEQMLSKQVQQRYMSYYSGFGSRLVSGEVSMEECEDYHKKNQNSEISSPKNEHLDLIFQRYVDTSNHV